MIRSSCFNYRAAPCPCQGLLSSNLGAKIFQVTGKYALRESDGGWYDCIMTNQPEAITKILDALEEIQRQVNDTLDNAKTDPDMRTLGEISPDFALEATLDFIDPEDLSMLRPELAEELLEFLTKF